MSLPEIIETYLRRHHIQAEEHSHPVTYTARQMAEVERMPDDSVCKTVFFHADDQMVMGVLPVNRNLNLHLVRSQMGCSQARLATEREIAQHVNTLQLGAIPPFGSLFGLPVVMDKALMGCDTIDMPGGIQTQSIHMPLADYLREEAPQIKELSRKPIRRRSQAEEHRRKEFF